MENALGSACGIRTVRGKGAVKLLTLRGCSYKNPEARQGYSAGKRTQVNRAYWRKERHEYVRGAKAEEVAVEKDA